MRNKLELYFEQVEEWLDDLQREIIWLNNQLSELRQTISEIKRKNSWAASELHYLIDD